MRQLKLPAFILAVATVIAVIGFALFDEGASTPGSLQVVDVSPEAPFSLYPGLYLYEIDSGTVRRLDDLRDSYGATFSVSPDGQRVAVSHGTREHAIAILNLRTGDVEARLEDAGFLVDWLSETKLSVSIYDDSLNQAGIGVIDSATGALEAFVPGVEASRSRWSPDGALLAWTPWPHEVEGGLWLIDAKTGERRRIAPGPHSSPRWTSDGRALLVYGWRESDQANGLKRFERSGDDLTLVSFEERPFDFAGANPSPDGRLRMVARTDSSGEEPRAVLYVESVGGAANLRRLATGGDASWSPDSRSIAYVRDGELWAVDVASGAERSLVQPQMPVIASPAWLSGGKAILFAALGGGSGIYLAAADGSDPTYLVQGADPQFSPDGTRVSFSYGECALGCYGKVYTMTPDATDIRPVVRSYSGDVAPICPQSSRAEWSPDSRYIAVTSGFGGSERIFVVPVDGHGPSTIHGPDAAGASWSADSTKIAYSTSTRLRERPCEVRIADARGVRVLQTIDARGYPQWSPDGRWLAVAAAEGIAYLDPREPGSWSIAGRGTGFAWSPDSRRLAYRGFNEGLMVTDIFTGQTIRVLAGPNFASIAWTPDGRIVYSFGDPGEIWVVDAREGAGATKIADGRSPSFSPDGRRLLFSR